MGFTWSCEEEEAVMKGRCYSREWRQRRVRKKMRWDEGRRCSSHQISPEHLQRDTLRAHKESRI